MYSKAAQFRQGQELHAAGFVINAILPIVSTMSGTFQSSTHESDVRMRTDFKIVATFGNPTDNKADIYMKNIGKQPISLVEMQNAVVFCGTTVGHLLIYDDTWTVNDDSWTAEILPDTANVGYWDTGETLHVTAWTPIDPGETVYFQFVLPNGIWRSQEFNAELS